MADHPNAAIVRAAGEEIERSGDMLSMMHLLSDDIVWHAPGNSPLSGDYRGKQEVLGFFAKMQELGVTSMNLEIHDILANDEHATVMVETRVTRGDDHLDSRQVHVWHLQDGKATEFWNIVADQAAADAFWS